MAADAEQRHPNFGEGIEPFPPLQKRSCFPMKDAYGNPRLIVVNLPY